jgi:hypothetical protein
MYVTFDYFPLDDLESATPAYGFAPGKQAGRAAELSLLQRASILLRKSFRNRQACR